MVQSPVKAEVHRIAQISGSSYDPSEYYYYSFTSVYHYSTINPTMIDSIIKTENHDSSLTSTRRFLHSVTVTPQDSTTSYLEYSEPDNTEIRTYTFRRDLEGKILETLISYQGVPSLQYIFHYDNMNKPDSIYYTSPGITTKCFRMYYDSTGKLDSSIVKNMYNNTWIPEKKFTLVYSPNPYCYQSPLDFNNYRQYSLNGGFETYNYIFDTLFKPDAILWQYWTDNGWSDYIYNIDQYTVIANDDDVSLIFYDPAYFFCYVDEFNNHGLPFLRDYHYEDIGIFWNWHEDITWQYNVFNEDQIIPVTTQIFSAYPNPFSVNLAIKVNYTVPYDVSVYNIKGQLVRSWKDVKADELTWDGKDTSNKPVSSGVYLIRTGQGKDISTAKVLKY